MAITVAACDCRVLTLFDTVIRVNTHPLPCLPCPLPPPSSPSCWLVCDRKAKCVNLTLSGTVWPHQTCASKRAAGAEEQGSRAAGRFQICGQKENGQNDLLADATNGYTQAAKAAECSQWSARYLKQLISSEINKFAEFNRVQKEQRATTTTTTATQGESRKQTGNWSVSEADNTQSKSESESESYALSEIVENVLNLVQ